MNSKFKGVFSALLTPFYDGQVDYISLEKHILFQMKHNISGFVVNGTTAESPTLTWDEVEKIFKCVKKLSAGCPLIVGVGSNSTAQTIENTKRANDMGADAVLVVVPYYNKPPQRGLIKHFSAVADASQIPVIIYNVPSRTITNLSVESIINLSKVKNIIGIKEASGNLDFFNQIKQGVSKEFVNLSGDDATYLDFLNRGGDGIISVMSNILPQECVRWTKNPKGSESAFNKYLKFINGLYVESNPIVSKWMLCKMGIYRSAEMRLPLVELDPALQPQIESLLKEFSII